VLDGEADVGGRHGRGGGSPDGRRGDELEVKVEGVEGVPWLFHGCLRKSRKGLFVYYI
jgi:hypothetical protein